MIEFPFDKETFNKNYAHVYNILKYVFIVGFIFIIIVLVLPANIITIPDALLPIVCAYLLLSAVGFPLVLVLKVGCKRLVSGSSLQYKNNTLIYKKLADNLWTAVGHVEEYHIYQVKKVDSIRTTKYSYVIYGKIEKTVINNKRELSKEIVDTVKIPNAYIGMERIKNYG